MIHPSQGLGAHRHVTPSYSAPFSGTDTLPTRPLGRVGVGGLGGGQSLPKTVISTISVISIAKYKLYPKYIS